jgi:hypothetical protein
MTDQTTGSSEPAPTKKNPFRIAQKWAAPAINGNAYSATQRVQMPGIKRIAPANSAEMQYHGVIEGYPLVAKRGNAISNDTGTRQRPGFGFLLAAIFR